MPRAIVATAAAAKAGCRPSARAAKRKSRSQESAMRCRRLRRAKGWRALFYAQPLQPGEVLERGAIRWIQLERPARVAQCLRVPPRCGEHAREVGVDHRGIRPEADRPFEMRDRLA